MSIASKRVNDSGFKSKNQLVSKEPKPGKDSPDRNRSNSLTNMGFRSTNLKKRMPQPQKNSM